MGGNFDESVLNQISASNPAMRVTFFFSYLLIACGIVIRVFRTYQINYLHIFEFDFRVKLADYQLIQAGMILLFLWTFAFSLNIMDIVLMAPPKLDGGNEENGGTKNRSDWITVILIVIIILICVQPFVNCFYKTARFELLYTIW